MASGLYETLKMLSENINKNQKKILNLDIKCMNDRIEDQKALIELGLIIKDMQEQINALEKRHPT